MDSTPSKTFHGSFRQLSDCSSFSSHERQKTDSKNAPGISKVHQALADCEQEMGEVGQLRIIYECLQDLAQDQENNLDEHLREKLKETINIHKMKSYLRLPNNSKNHVEEHTLLGIEDLRKYEFGFNEKKTIKTALLEKLQHKFKQFEPYRDATKDISRNSESKICSRFLEKGELENLDRKKKIDEVCAEYKKDLRRFEELLEKLELMKIKMNDKCTKEAEIILLSAELRQLQAHLTKETCKKKMLEETPFARKAWETLNDKINERIVDASEEIAKKQSLLKEFEHLSKTPEFNEILKEYLEVCDTIERKQKLLDKLE